MSDQPDSVGKISLSGHLRGHFLAGILVTAPIAITAFITWKFLHFVGEQTAIFIPEAYRNDPYLSLALPLLGIVAAISFFIIVGWFTRNFLGRLIISASEFVVGRIPLIRTVYNTLKQIFQTMMGGQAKAFRDVVMFEYPRAGCWTIGFVTGVTPGEVQTVSDDEVMNVYIPTTPNPTAGFLLLMPKRDLIHLSMTVEEAVKLIVSGGIITPPDRSKK